MTQVSSITPDWEREVPRCFWDHRRKLLNIPAGEDWSETWIGGHVDIGAGAKIIRNIKVANDVLIGAHTVVVKM